MEIEEKVRKLMDIRSAGKYNARCLTHLLNKSDATDDEINYVHKSITAHRRIIQATIDSAKTPGDFMNTFSEMKQSLADVLIDVRVEPIERQRQIKFHLYAALLEDVGELAERAGQKLMELSSPKVKEVA